MLKDTTLSVKISVGFVILLLIAFVLGIVAVVNMKSVEGVADKLANQYVPEVDIANNVERSSLATMNAIKSYSLSEDKEYLKEGRNKLKDVDKYLTEIEALGNKYEGLVKLREVVGETQKNVTLYEKLVEDRKRR